MASKAIRGLLLGFVLIATGCASAQAADLSVISGRGRAVGTYHCLGFCGQPFPTGYRWSIARACRELVEVDTPSGPRVRSVWACSIPARYAWR
jgi:hypothetical protein